MMSEELNKSAVTLLEYCRYGVKPKTIIQSINHLNKSVIMEAG